MNELLDKRTFTQKQFGLGDNQYQMEAHIGHIHYRDGALKNGAFHNIDTTLNYNSVSKKYSMTNASYEAEIGLYGDVRFHNVDHSLQFTLPNPSLVEATAYDGSAFGRIGKGLIWRDIIQDGGHQIVESRNGSLAKIFHFDKKPLSNIIEFNVSFSNVEMDTDIDTTGKQKLVGSHDRKSYIRGPKAWNHRGEQVNIRLIVRKNGTAMKIIPQSFINSTFADSGAWMECDTTTSYWTGAGDGRVGAYLTWTTYPTWAEARNANYWNANPENGLSTGWLRIGNRGGGSEDWPIWHIYYPTDTSGIPRGASIINASFFHGAEQVFTPPTNTIALILTTQSDPTTLADTDWDNIVLNSPDEGAPRKNWSAYGNGAPSREEYVLNSIGRSWINKTGYTLFGMREGSQDVDNVTPPLNVDQIIDCYFSENAGTNLDPYLSVTYVAPTSYLGGRTTLNKFRRG